MIDKSIKQETKVKLVNKTFKIYKPVRGELSPAKIS